MRGNIKSLELCLVKSKAASAAFNDDNNDEAYANESIQNKI